MQGKGIAEGDGGRKRALNSHFKNRSTLTVLPNGGRGRRQNTS